MAELTFFNGIQTILFDLDGTLRYSLPSGDRVMMDYAVQLGAPDSPENRRRTARWVHYYWAQSPELMLDLERYPDMGEPFWVNYARRKLQIFDCPAEWIEELAAKIQRYMAEQYQPDDHIPEYIYQVLAALRSAGYRLGLVTNRTYPIDDYLKTTGLAEYFQSVVVAGQVGAWKPDPAIFQPALKALGSLPSQTLYVGDNFYADIQGARAAGIQPVLLDPDEIFDDCGCHTIQTIEQLTSLVTLPGNF